jgi:CheY-like chemotaxis protein
MGKLSFQGNFLSLIRYLTEKEDSMPAVLVVDDEPVIRMNIAATFEDAGCETFQAASSMDAIKRLMSNDRVDVVFTDIQMPGTMDGLALANYVQEHWPDMYIIVSSGFHLPDRRALPRNSHFVAKPVRQDRLTEIANDVCKRAAHD